MTAYKTRRSVSVLGSTGSIGRSTVDLLAAHRDMFQVQLLTAGRNAPLLAEQARLLSARYVVIADETQYGALKDMLAGTGIGISAGAAAVIDAASHIEAEWTMAAIVGAAGIRPTLGAIRRGETVALANKESLVSAGQFMMDAVDRCGTRLLPVDSEHNAVFQVLDPARRHALKRIILTASGGGFLRKTRAELVNVTPAEAVKHPNWSMGAKISVDSATMMNKALEIIEASYLFKLESDQIDAVIHPQSIVHSMVEYIDGSILAQMGAADMRTPIAYCLGFPDRVQTTGDMLDLFSGMNLSFEQIDNERFPAINMARQALSAPAGATAVLNAANEEAVTAFLSGGLRFTDIENIVDATLQKVDCGAISCIEDILALDAQTRKITQAEIAARARA